ncbi:MAG: hypothetical protein KDG54_15135 [Geminicoccaceae bacterium]|nr:hypothetical protein [Geminicoccaceae bacterium]
MIHVRFLDRNKNPISMPGSYVVQKYDMDALGGPVSASIIASGQRSTFTQLRQMLGFYVVLSNDTGDDVWWGMVDGLTANFGGIGVGVSMLEMRNRLRVLYTVRDGDGYAVSLSTDWIEHERSVDLYGRRESIVSAGETSEDGASAFADRELDRLGLPKQIVDLSSRGNDEAVIRCVGVWSTLARTYYANIAGREFFAVQANAYQALGWGFTASDVGFADRSLHRVSGGLDAPQKGEAIRVTGSPLNSGTYTVEEEKTGEATFYSASTISFDPINDINDSADGLGFVRNGNWINVVGDADNGGYHLVDEIGRGHIAIDELVTQEIITKAAGPTISIYQGQSLGLVVNAFDTEEPGASVTVSGYSKIAYSWTPTENVAAWKAAEIWIRAQKVGDPADSLRVDLCADGGGQPGTVLDYQTISGADMLKTPGWIKLDLARVADITYGSTYWVNIYRTGANSATDYYLIGVDEDQQRGGGTLLLWNGASWVSRGTDADLPFQVWGHTQTTDQIGDILGTEGQFLEGDSVRADSAIYRRQYREGSNDALYELEKLIAEGTSAGEILLPTVNRDFHAVVEAAPTSYDPPYVLRRGPRLTTAHGKPLAEGILPVGEWCAVDGVPDDVGGLLPLSPFLLGYLEYDAVKGRISDLRAYDTDSILNFAQIAQG